MLADELQLAGGARQNDPFWRCMESHAGARAANQIGGGRAAPGAGADHGQGCEAGRLEVLPAMGDVVVMVIGAIGWRRITRFGRGPFPPAGPVFGSWQRSCERAEVASLSHNVLIRRRGSATVTWRSRPGRCEPVMQICG